MLQQQATEVGALSTRTIIDGQQRLTTLQILIDAVRRQLDLRDMHGLSQQARDLVQNQEAYQREPEDAFKVWPTNRDRSVFQSVMSAPDSQVTQRETSSSNRLEAAHQYFMSEIDDWLNEGETEKRARALVDTVSRFLQLVVIDLQFDEDAQEIFETLNARGTPLTAADLIKNFVFQRLDLSSEKAERAYRQYWQEFETPFWEQQVSAGRIQYTRSSLFLTQWLVSQTKEEITAREVFNRFKAFVADSSEPVEALLPKLRASADVYRRLITASEVSAGELTREELFVYRMSVLDSEVIKPLLLWLLEPANEAVPQEQLEKGLTALESWAVRRAILRLSSKNYNRLVVELLTLLTNASRNNIGDEIEKFLANQTADSGYWPSDEEILTALTTEPIYRRLNRGRLRMVLEALEDDRRGFTLGRQRFSEGPVVRAATSIEHVMPQDWRSNWAEVDSEDDDMNLDSLVHNLGNLTLVTQALNSKVSNYPWQQKRLAFEDHTTLLLTADLLRQVGDDWSPDQIEKRSAQLAERVVHIWPVPNFNKGKVESRPATSRSRVAVADLVNQGYLKAGQKIYARVQAHFGREAYVSEDGAIYVEDNRCETPSGAAKFVTKSTAEPGWWFWVTDLEAMVSLSDLRAQFITDNEVDPEDEEATDEGF